MRSAKHDGRIVSDKKIKWNGQIWTFEIFYCESLKATERLPVCFKMCNMKHDERISISVSP